MSQFQFQRVLACVLFLVFAQGCVGFAGATLQTTKATSSSPQPRSFLNMYVRPQQQQPSSQPKETLNMIPNPTSIGPTIRRKDQKKAQEQTQRSYSTKLSNSVLADCNTLPSFPTAHGILSPETVMRMEEMAEFEGRSSEAVNRFLKQYRRNGPMSCLSMLSDPDVLPHLTRAMRDVV